MIHNISIVVPSLGKLNNLQRLILSIEKQNLSKENFEILIAVNGVSDNSIFDAIRDWSREISMNLEVNFLKNKGVNLARNFGLTKTKNELVLFLDDDCELISPFFLSEHISAHNKNPGLFAVGGGYELPQDSRYLDTVYNVLQMGWFISGISESSSAASAKYLLGGNFSIKKSMALANNLTFDEKIIYGGSEFEFFKKADISGLVMAHNDLDVVHHTHESLHTLTKKIFKQGKGKAFIDFKYPQIKDAGEINEDSNKNNSLNIFVRLYFNYVFWCGYYAFQKKYFAITVHAIKDIIGFFNAIRFRFLDKLSNQINNRKEKGDRF